jgi:hypothetical protein
LKNKFDIRHRVQGTRTKALSISLVILLVPCILFLVPFTIGCKVHYGFSDKTSIPDTIKTIRINQIENKARYINPQLSPALTDKFRQKITSQTKLTTINTDNPDWEITGTIVDYSFTTSAISDQRVVNNRLTVVIHVTIVKHKEDGKIEDYDISRSFEFKGDLSFQQAEQALGDEMIRTLADEMFNKLFSKW